MDDKWKSRKLWSEIVGVLIIIIATAMGRTPEEIYPIVFPIVAYIFAQAGVDIKNGGNK